MQYNNLFDGRKISKFGFGLYKGEASNLKDKEILESIFYGLNKVFSKTQLLSYETSKIDKTEILTTLHNLRYPKLILFRTDYNFFLYLH